MKIQLDTEKKTIKLESSVEMSKLIETLNKLFPNKEWKKFTLETNTTIQNWNSPIVIHEHHDVYPRPYWQPWYSVVGMTNADYKVTGNNQVLNMGTNAIKGTINSLTSLKAGVFNVEA